MSEALLEALMQLFALLTDFRHESKTGRARPLVQDFLSKHFNSEYVDKYIERFDFYLNRYHSEVFSKDDTLKEKQTTDNVMRIHRIASQINTEMEQEAKMILLVQVLDFLQKDEKLGEIEGHFMDLLAEQFRIESSDYDNLKRFVLYSPLEVKDKSTLLYITGTNEKPHPNVKLLFNPKQQVKVWVLHLVSTNTFVFRYSGERNLYLNGHKVEPKRPYILSVGSVIKTSMMMPVYYNRVAEKFIHFQEQGRIVYRALDVSYKFNNNQIGIHPFSFISRSGQLVGVVGGSGTGKSTLLNVLNGNYKLSSGEIYINGYNLHTEKEHLQGVIGYVPQDDLLKEELTVYENLWYNALLCFDNLEHKEIKKIVDEALEDFDLVEARDFVVGNPLNKILSGGQRKRLNIALELIREPSILFVDEPTSGLSSMDSEKVMLLLKRQVLKGKLVIINIHQPSSDLYKLLDRLLMIDKGGRIIFNGNPMDAIAYFKSEASYVNSEERECYLCGNIKTEQPLRIVEARIVNPYGKLIRKRKVSPEEWYKLYIDNFENKFEWKRKIDFTKKETLPQNRFSIPSRKRQFKIFSKRDALSKLKDKQYLAINLLGSPLLALILGFCTKYLVGAESSIYLFSDNVNIPVYLFMAVIVAMFIGLNVSAEEIIKDRKLLKRESFLNLSRFSFLNSKIFVLFTISAFQTLVFVLIGNHILEIKGMTLSYWAILFSVAAFSNMIGLNISSGLNSVVAVYVLIPLILVPHLLFSGTIVSYENLHPSISSKEYVPIVGDIMVTRWGYEALAVNQFKNNDYQKHFFEAEKNMSQVSYYSSTLIPTIEQLNQECLSFYKKEDKSNLDIKWQTLKKALHQLKNEDVWNIENSTLDIEQFSDDYYAIIKTGLDSLQAHYNREYSYYSKQKDEKSLALISHLDSVEKVVELQQNHYNEALADWVLNRKDVKQVEYYNGKYIQKKNPIYKSPINKYGRAHFYAPTKKVWNINIPTPIFNCIVIWLGIAFLYITLYLDVLRRIIYFFEVFRLRQLNKRLQGLGT